MTKTKHKTIITIVILLTVVICVAISSFFIYNYIQRKQTTTFTNYDKLVLKDNVYQETIVLDITNYVNIKDTFIYISEPNVLQNAKNQLLAIDTRYTVQIYSDCLLYAYIKGESLLYLLRRDLYPMDNYGMRFSTSNTHELIKNANNTDNISLALIPFHLFSACNSSFTSNFPFARAIQSSDKIKLLNGVTLEDFAQFYNDLGKFNAVIDGLTITVANLDNTPMYKVNFDTTKSYVSYEPLT